jgi:hypothetical protein
MKRVHASDKPVLYSHIYSMSSVKSVVHWFQIMRSGRFQMYGGEGPSAVEEVRERVTGFEGGVDVKYSPAPSPSPSPSPLAEMASHRALYEYPTTSAGGSRPQSTAPNQQHHPVGLEGYRNGKISHSTAAQSSPPSAYTSSVPLRTPLLPQFTSLPRLPRSYHGRSAQVYPLGQIACPIHVCWGSADHLPDTAGLVRSLPRHATTERFEDYEHLGQTNHLASCFLRFFSCSLARCSPALACVVSQIFSTLVRRSRPSTRV